MSRIVALLREHELRIVMLTVVATFALGFWAMPGYFPDQTLTTLDRVYLCLQLFILQLPPVAPRPTTVAIEAARFLGAGVAFYAVLRTLAVVFAGELERFRLRRLSGHVVVCGLGRKGLQLVKDFLRHGERVVVIEHDEENDHVVTARDLGATVLIGDAAEESLLTAARAHRARHVVALCGDDGLNIQLALHAHRVTRREAPQRAQPLGCHVHIVDLRLCALLKNQSVLGREGGVEVRIFNMYESGARVLQRERPLDRAPIGADDPRVVHLVVIGFGQMGESVAIHAAQQAHFANARRARVTVVDRLAEQKRGSFFGRYPSYEKVCDLEFVRGDIEDPTVLGALSTWGQDDAQLLSVVVCFDDDRRALAVALTLIDLFRQRRVPIAVRMSQEAGLSALTLQPEAGAAWAGRIAVFGLLDRLCTRENVLNEALDLVARTGHERYLARKLAEGEKLGARPALRPWAELDESYRESNRQQADHIPVKLRAVGCRAVPGAGAPFAFTPEEVELLARMEHARWSARHWLAGWTWGPVRNDAERVHDCLVPWEQLGEAFRENDRNAVRMIPELLALVGQRIEREVRIQIPAG
jgi:voltage-gated potassium channel Kch